MAASTLVFNSISKQTKYVVRRVGMLEACSKLRCYSGSQEMCLQSLQNSACTVQKGLHLFVYLQPQLQPPHSSLGSTLAHLGQGHVQLLVRLHCKWCMDTHKAVIKS